MTHLEVDAFGEPVRACVLVVDDDVAHRASLARLLELDGFTVLEAARVEPAVLQSLQHDVAVVLCDLCLGGDGDGMDVARMLSARQRRPYLIAYSGLGGAQVRQRCKRAGFDRFLMKPAPPAKLLETIREGAGEGPTRHRVA